MASPCVIGAAADITERNRQEASLADIVKKIPHVYRAELGGCIFREDFDEPLPVDMRKSS